MIIPLIASMSFILCAKWGLHICVHSSIVHLFVIMVCADGITIGMCLKCAIGFCWCSVLLIDCLLSVFCVYADMV